MRNRVLIFGGTRGLGAALTSQWARKGYEVISVGREQCDLANKEAIRLFLNSLEGSFETVVLCAGYSAAGKVLDVPLEEFERCYQINFFAPLQILQHFAKTPPMSFVLILSGTAEVFFPGLSAYSLSKRAIRDLARHLKTEVPSLKIHLIYPGGMKTDFDRNTKIYGGYLLPKNPRLRDPQVVAREVIGRVEKGFKFRTPILLRLVGILQDLFPRVVGKVILQRSKS